MTYDWSSVATIQWAAFYNDVKYEILPLTRGHCITLTYKLHCDQLCSKPAVDICTNPFYKELKTALDHPHFLRDGGVLAFFCQYSYTFEEVKSTLYHLKGSDGTFLMVSKSLGLKTEVVPIIVELDTFVEGTAEYYMGTKFGLSLDIVREDENWNEFYARKNISAASGVIWCNKIGSDEKLKPAFVSMVDPDLELDVRYAAACILATVPPWNLFRTY